MSPKLAIYARYSSDQQRETSIDDQLRRCRECAHQMGLSGDQALVFTDEALSGTSKHNDKRTGYQALLAAWDRNQFEVLVVDEFSRLTRDGLEQAKIVQRLENNRRVRLITCDGIDSNIPTWHLHVGLVGLIGQQAIRDTQHRVERGMVGQLERGYMVATPAYGYALHREFDARGNRLGTHWLVNDQEAPVLREIFSRREAGESMHHIAAWLNDTGIPCSRQATTDGGGYWRPARIAALLKNTIYRGEFRWHGSATYSDKANKKGMPVDVRVFQRPGLRLVSDETWHRCQGKVGSRTGYGSGKHALAGIVTCGCCGGTLAVSAGKSAASLYCPSCTVAKHVDGQGERLSVTIATSGVHYLLSEAMKLLLSPAFLDAFREALRLRLAGDDTQALDEARVELARQVRAQDRLSRLLAADDMGDSMLESRYSEARAKVRDLQDRVEELEAGKSRIPPDVLEAQLQVDPAEVLAGLFQEDLPPHRLRTVIGRLFPSVVFLGKERRYTALFSLRFAPGIALAEASGTTAVVNEQVEMRFSLSYSPSSHFDAREQRWTVTRLEEPLSEPATPPEEHPAVPMQTTCAV